MMFRYVVATPVFLLFIVANFLTSGVALSQDDAHRTESRRVVAAVVDAQQIYTDEVELELLFFLAANGRAANDENIDIYRARTLELLIDRQLVLDYLRNTSTMAEEGEADRLMKNLKGKLARQGLGIEHYVQRLHTSVEALRQQQFWKISWSKFISEQSSPEKLKATFDKYRTQIDPGKIAVSHILLRPKDEKDKQEMRALENKALSIRKEIISGSLSFAQAANKYSDAPSASDGGDLGSMARTGEMAESFAAAAFSLSEGEISQPVTTRFGIHLIQCRKIIPGDRNWESLRPRLSQLFSKDMFQEISEERRKAAEISYTGYATYRDPLTKKIVPPKVAGQD